MIRARIAVVPVGLLLAAVCASAAVKNTNVRITVLDSETHSVSLGDNGVPKNCDAVNYDAYCHNSKTVEVTNTLLVQEGNQPPFRISCAVDTKWSRCVPLPKGASYDAKREKRGLLVYYADDNGKVRKQLYTLITPEAGGTAPGAAPNAAPVSAAPNSGAAGSRGQATAPAAGTSESVKCNFRSTPSGAEITVDGQYVGSTPSEVSLSTGKHVVVISTLGFGQWKRELTVLPDLELTVNAVLEKAQ